MGDSSFPQGGRAPGFPKFRRWGLCWAQFFFLGYPVRSCLILGAAFQRNFLSAVQAAAHGNLCASKERSDLLVSPSLPPKPDSCFKKLFSGWNMKLGGEPAFFINKLSSSPLLNRTLYFYLQLNVADRMVLLQFISPFLFTLMLFNVCLLIIQKRKQLEVVVDFVV